MSLLDKINIESRTIGGVPWQPWRNPYWKFNVGGPVHPSRSGSNSQDTVLGLAAVYASVRFLADAIASLPIKVYRRLPDGTSQLVMSSMLLGDEISGGGPQVSGSMYDWLFEGSTSALLHGNAWGLITNRSGIPGADGNGLPTGIAWLPPERVSVQDDEQQPENPLRARIYYNGRLMDRTELIQMKAFAVAGRVEGISPIRYFATLWQQGLQALQYSSDWFANGGFPPGTFQNVSEEVTESQSNEIRRRLTDAIRLRQPLVYGSDWDYKPITVPQDEATFITAMQLNATQIAAIYGVRAQRVGGTRNDGLAYSNQTEDMLDELQNTLRPWLRRWEFVLTSMLPSTQFAKFDTDSFLKMDPKTRTGVYEIQRNIGTRTVNELRAEDDKPPLKGGDDPFALQIQERMMATTRSIPKDFMPNIILEADRIAAMLEHMAEIGLTNPVAEQTAPIGKSAEGYLGGLITQIRSNPELAHSARLAEKVEQLLAAGASPRVIAVAISEALSNAAEHQDKDWETPATPKGLFGNTGYRASDGDRERAKGMIRAHGKAGRLRPPEVEERVRKAAEAVRCGDLDSLFADLPVVETAASHREEDRSREPTGPMFGPAAIALLQQRAMQFDSAAPAALNGKAH